MMKRAKGIVCLAVAMVVMAGVFAPAGAGEFFAAKLRGGNETPVSLSTAGSGVWGGQLSDDEMSLTFQLHYAGLEGGAVTGAHIHLGKPGISGGIVIHLCGTGGKPACPASPGLVTGVLTAADVVAVAAQGIAAGELDEVIEAMRRGDTYINVHTTTFPSGEIRGPVE